MGEKVTYDSSIKTIIVDEAPVWNGVDWIVEIDVKVDIFSDGKEDWLADDTLNKFKFPVTTAGGDELPGIEKLGATFFFEYGWKIRPYEADHVLKVNGNLYSRDGSSPFVRTIDDYNIILINTVSNLINTITPDIGEYYTDRIYIDPIDGTSGTDAPQGTSHHPVDNLDDALFIADRENIDTLDCKYSINIPNGYDISNYTLIADRSIGNVVTVEAGAITDNTYFENLTVSGAMNGTVRYTTCVMGVIYNFDGGAKNSLLTGNITITGNGLNYFTDCDVYITDPAILREINVDGHTLNLIRCRGGYKITNKTSTNTLAIDLVAGIVEIASDCLAGSVFIGGIAEVIDNSAEGCNVMIKSMSHEAISQNVWDEPLTGSNHNIATTAGRRMRTLSSSVILNENAIGPGTGNNQIQFGPDASIDEGAYDPAVISIINGTGAGQTRNILQYNGATKTATVDRDWRVNPDDTSEYVIVSDAGREHVNEGLATDGGIDTISLNIDASSIDEAYTGQVIFIRSGTGQDQACRCKSYDGATRTATICSDWAIIPDTTSGYVVLPTAAIKAEALGEAIWTDPRAVDLIADMAFIKQVESGKWHVTSNQMIFYEDDNVTEIMRFNLFDENGNPADENVFRREKV